MPIAPSHWLFPNQARCGCIMLGRGSTWHVCQHREKCALSWAPSTHPANCEGCKKWGELPQYIEINATQVWDNKEQKVLYNGS